ncbi:MAG: sulfatase family protein [Verrucomicrobiales bacterium]|nr:sulfatase [Verrucomicrobiota bacterium JB025]
MKTLRRKSIGLLVGAWVGVAAGPVASRAAAGTGQPNFIVILTDDQGYADLGCFGGTEVSTPRIDRMAEEGARLTSFYVGGAVCTPSRAALMTGSYPKRIGMAGGVLVSGDANGLNPDEVTIAELLKGVGYATGIVGKWHLGDQPVFLPPRHGFDEYFGIPYSHDIHPYHPNRGDEFPPLPLLDGGRVVELEPDADLLTRRVTEHAVNFIEAHQDGPFFLYVAHPAPHRPISVSPPFLDGVSDTILDALAEEEATGTVDYEARDNLYRRAVNEVDWSVGEILDALDARGIDEETLVIFTSDNGPSVNALGQVTPLRGSKGSTLEGGYRMPTVVRWPGRISPGTTNDEIMTTMDLLPTFTGLAGAAVPTDRVLDGMDVWPVLGEGGSSPHEAVFYYQGNTLQAVRSGKWKLRLGVLYDLDEDAGEGTDVSGEHPDIVARLEGYMDEFAAELAANSRPVGAVETAHELTRVSSTVRLAGDGSGYDETGEAAQGFRSTGIAKGYDVGDEVDGVYGTAGYLFFGDGTAGTNLPMTSQLSDFPAWVTGHERGAGTDATPVGVFASYPKIDDPTREPGPEVADLANTGHVLAANEGAGTWSEVLKFTISEHAPGFRLGVMSGHEEHEDGRWDPTGIRLSVAGGTAVAVEAGDLENLTGTVGMVFFDVTTDGTTGDTFSIEARQRLDGQGVLITGVTFDWHAVERVPLEIRLAEGISGTVELSWDSKVGFNYRIWSSESLAEGSWVPGVEGIGATPPRNSLSLDSGGGRRMFYRVEMKPD